MNNTDWASALPWVAFWLFASVYVVANAWLSSQEQQLQMWPLTEYIDQPAAVSALPAEVRECLEES